MNSARPPHGEDGTTAAPALAVAAVARRLGVAPATLRTWDRRYGLGPSERAAGSHRRYNAEDVARLFVMRQLTLDGVAPVDAARVAIETHSAELATAASIAGPAFPSALSAVHSDAVSSPSAATDPSAATSSAASTHPVTPAGQPDESGQPRVQSGRPYLRAIQGGGGHRAITVYSDDEPVPEPPARGTTSLPAGRATPNAQAATPPSSSPTHPPTTTHQAAGGHGHASSSASERTAAAIDAALLYDEAACAAALRIEPEDDPGSWWTDVVSPALHRIGQRTILGAPGEVPEMVLASAALAALRSFIADHNEAQIAAGNPPATHPSRMRNIVLIFAPPDETIPLAAHALAAALVTGGATVRIVTGPASARRAVELVTMVRPAAVVVATMLAHPDLGVVNAIHNEFEDLPLLVSLRREASTEQIPLAASVQRVRTVQGLIHEVLDIVQ